MKVISKIQSKLMKQNLVRETKTIHHESSRLTKTCLIRVKDEEKLK